MNDNHITKDEGLQGNEKIEEAIAALQKELTDEMLAHTLTVIRRRMKAKGQLILAVDAPGGDGIPHAGRAGVQQDSYNPR